MSILQFLRGETENVMSGIKQQQGVTSGVLDQVKGYVPKIQGAWIGGDANEFAADVARKVVPAMTELIAAIAGVNLNLTKAISTIDQADSKVKSMADGLGETFGNI